MAEQQAPAAAAEAADQPKTKVFVGNLSFKTRQAELSDEFSKIGKVVNAVVVTRGTRSMGYGFVEYESEADANKAVETLNDKELGGRVIKVEITKVKAEGERRPPAGQRRKAAAAAAPKAEGEPAADAAAAAPAAKGRGRGRGGRRNRGQPRAAKAAAEGDAAAAPAAAKPAREPRQQAKKEPSKTTLFVKNLPFNVDDEALVKIFEGLQIKSARVVRRPNGRSKGFGFVEFENEDKQKAAQAAVDKKEVDGRTLSVSVALTGAEEGAAEPAAAAKAEN